MDCKVGSHPPGSICADCPDKDKCPADVQIKAQEDFSNWEVRMGENAVI
jgi:hypothetical protein